MTTSHACQTCGHPLPAEPKSPRNRLEHYMSVHVQRARLIRRIKEHLGEHKCDSPEFRKLLEANGIQPAEVGLKPVDEMSAYELAQFHGRQQQAEAMMNSKGAKDIAAMFKLNPRRR